MIRLIFFDLKDHALTWIGAFIVALGCGYVGGWVVSLRETASFYTDYVQKLLETASSSILVFSLIAGVAVLVSAANLTVSTQRRSYALWQLVNVNPRRVTVIVLVQLATVAVLGAIGGTLLAAMTFEPLFPWLFNTRQEVAQVIPYVGIQSMPFVWLVVVAVFLCGGLRGARSAGKTPPLTVLREPEPKHTKMTWLRFTLFLVLTISTGWLYSVMAESTPNDAMSWSIFIPVFVVATLVPVAPLIFSRLLSAWTSLIPQKHWNAWYLARHSARYGLSTSTSVETPIMVGFGLVAGLFSVMNVLASLARSQGATDTTGYVLGSTETLLMLGAPVLLCAIGAAVSVAMSSRSRTHDIALLTANGAKPQTLVAASVCEAFVHTVTATLVGMIGVVISTAIVAYSLGLSLFNDFTFKAGLVVSLVGFVLVLIATLIPTLSALRQETVTVLTLRE